MIPLVDLGIQHREVADEVRAGWDAVLSRTAFILGDEVREFEESFATFADVPHCIGVANGTDAIELALRACGIGEGHDVLVPANTFIATAVAVVRAGATPVLVDVDPDSMLIDVAQVKDHLGPDVRAVVPVHLYGQLAPMEELLEVVDGRDILVIEDAAQCQGARRNGRHAGRFGLAAATSFYPGKNLGAYGDAGAVLTESDEVAAHLRKLRNLGGEVKYEHPELGFNSRLDTMHAVVLSAKLKRLAAWNEQRRAAAAIYDELLAPLSGVQRPTTVAGNEHVWHLYVVQVAERDAVLAHVQAAGVGAGIHYPIPIHLQGAFAHLGHGRGDFPVTEHAADTILSLPIFPGITREQQETVAEALGHAINA